MGEKKIVSFKKWRERIAVLSRSDVANKMGFSPEYISMIEVHYSYPKVNFRKKFITAFGREVYDMIEEFSESYETDRIIKEKTKEIKADQHKIC
jgi:predicted transcriptional regulator